MKATRDSHRRHRCFRRPWRACPHRRADESWGRQACGDFLQTLRATSRSLKDRRCPGPLRIARAPPMRPPRALERASAACRVSPPRCSLRCQPL